MTGHSPPAGQQLHGAPQNSGRSGRARVAGWFVARSIVVIAAGLLAVSSLFAADVGAQQRRVVVVGDSIILGAQATMTRAFEDLGWQVVYDAAVSRSTAAGGDAIQSHAAELTDTLVVNLGANDAGNTEAYRRNVERILDATSSVPHVYWVTIREVREYYPAANQAVRDAVVGRPNVTVLDWNAHAAGSDGWTSGDGLHLTGTGAEQMSVLVTFAAVAGGAAPVLPYTPIAALPPAPDPVQPVPTTTVVAPATTAPTAQLGDPVAPETTVAPGPTTDSAPSSTAAPTTPGETEPSDDETTASSTVDYGNAFTWTVGSGLAVVVIALALIGAGVGGWALFAARGRPSGSRTAASAAANGTTAAGPAVSGEPPSDRARQRSQRIAAARLAAEPAPSVMPLSPPTPPAPSAVLPPAAPSQAPIDSHLVAPTSPGPAGQAGPSEPGIDLSAVPEPSGSPPM